jgi:MYXO-CTERM domain-containing protein
MKATPANPTFVEQRDAILNAALASKRMDDFSALAQGFATRGLGVGAVAPPSTSMTLNEAVENFDFKGALALADATLDDSGTNCDHDGILDPNETGKLTVKIKNSGWLKLTKVQVKATSTDANITFTESAVGDSGAGMLTVDPYETKEIVLTATAKPGIAKKVVPISITMTDPDAVKDSVTVVVQAPVNYDDTKASSKTDDVESTLPPVWDMTHMPKLSVDSWTRDPEAMTNNHFWHGTAQASPGDEALASPALAVSATEAFTMSFKHHYAFEVGTGANAGNNFDGAVIEVSEDGGTTWKDVSEYVDPAYTGLIFTSTDPASPDMNALAGRQGFVGRSAGYPANVDVKLDFGMKLAGKMAKVRFRIGTDDGTGTDGWALDDIAFTGITNTPFAKVGDNAGVCADGGATPTDGGAKPDSGSAGTGGAGGTGGSTGTGGTGTTDDSCNCSVPGGRSGSGTAAVGVFGALAMLLRGRRRRQG